MIPGCFVMSVSAPSTPYIAKRRGNVYAYWSSQINLQSVIYTNFQSKCVAAHKYQVAFVSVSAPSAPWPEGGLTSTPSSWWNQYEEFQFTKLAAHLCPRPKKSIAIHCESIPYGSWYAYTGFNPRAKLRLCLFSCLVPPPPQNCVFAI